MKRGIGAAIILIGVTALSATSARAQVVVGACCKTDLDCRDSYTQAQCDSFSGQFNPGLACSQVDCSPSTTVTTSSTSTTSTTVPPPLACRMTGGGNDTFPWDGTFAEGESGPNRRVDRYTFGGQAGAPGGSQPQPFGEWTHHQQRGPDGKFVFHAGTHSAPEETEIDLIECSDPGFCNPARHAPAKQLDFEGVGQFNNIGRGVPSTITNVATANSTFHWFHVHIEDAGEGGNTQSPKNLPESECPAGGNAGTALNCDCADYYSIRIHAGPTAASPVIYHVEGYITGGNLQIHPPLG
jgi:hypothetical protein